MRVKQLSSRAGVALWHVWLALRLGEGIFRIAVNSVPAFRRVAYPLLLLFAGLEMNTNPEPIYLDTSAVLPYYRQEPLSDTVQDLLVHAESPLVITFLTKVEVASSLARWVRMGDLPESDAAAIQVAFGEDVQAGRYEIRGLQSRHYEKAEEWLLMRRLSLRMLDAIHLAFAALSPASIVTADRGLAEAAKTFGVRHRLLALHDT